MTTVLGQAQFAANFTFARSEASAWRDAGGVIRTAAVNTPCFDHDEDGQPLGLLVEGGTDYGGDDRAAIRTTALPAGVFDAETYGASIVTIFHRFRPEGAAEHVRTAWYSRNAKKTIDALLAQAGHHAELGVVRAFIPARAGAVHYRDQAWSPAGLLMVGKRALTDGAGHPLIIAGAAKNV